MSGTISSVLPQPFTGTRIGFARIVLYIHKLCIVTLLLTNIFTDYIHVQLYITVSCSCQHLLLYIQKALSACNIIDIIIKGTKVLTLGAWREVLPEM